MCGIGGVLNFNQEPVSEIRMKKMGHAIKHRGPDDDGVYIKENLGLVHVRLSILDLSSAGHQPMQTQDGKLTLVYNGEIYNYKELRVELESLGYHFNSNTDTEVVLKAIHCWGIGVISRFNGMFAFALFDRSDKSLYLARDRYGIKPLYWSLNSNNIVFCSEIKGILASELVKAEVNKEAVVEYFTFQNFFSQRTLFKNINMLEQGSYVKIGLSGEIQKPVKYWDFRFQQPTIVRSDADYIDEVRYHLKRAVTRQLVSDVDVGVYLSGGIDSGSITAISASELKYIKSFTCGFDLSSASGMELGFDERAPAELMSYRFKTELYQVILKAGDMERVMKKLAYYLEEPRVGQSYPNYYAAQLASKFVKVVLSGAGGDEIFGGYPWRYYRAAVNRNFEEYVNKYYGFWQRMIPNDSYGEFFTPIQGSFNSVDCRDIFKGVLSNHHFSGNSAEDYINQSMYLEAKTFLHGLLVVEDKISMAHSIETRVPFLDNDLVDCAMNLPMHLKLSNLKEVVRLNENEPGPKTEKYFNIANDGKLILRKIMGDYLPDEILNRKKQGFSAPDATWFKGESIEYVKSKILHKNSRIYEFLDDKTVNKLVGQHLEGSENRRLLIWSLLNFEMFLENYIG